MLILPVACALAQSDAAIPMTANQIAEARQADEYFKASNCAEALPLFEDLAKKLPSKAVYAERVGDCLMRNAGLLTAGPEKDALVMRALSELRRAQSLGDNSELVQITLDRIRNVPITPAFQAPKTATDAKMETAGIAFTKGDMASALADYQAAAALNPHLYEAPLYAGDVFFRQKDYQQAGEWFQKAIAINPNRETAYRYWADALAAAGDAAGARDRYIDALIAEPYARAPGLILQRWAKKNSILFAPPSVPDSHAPNPEEDSLAAAAARLKAMLPNAELTDLTKLAAANMIEPFLLISAPNPGIARGYAAYRAAHRDQLIAYVLDFVLHPTVPPSTP